MENPVAHWLKAQFRDIQDVKYATAQPPASITSRSHEPDVIVETWMNSRLYVYVVSKTPKSRFIKGILKQNSHASVGTLFLIDISLLPADGYAGKLQDWQDDLRALNKDAIYAIGLIEGRLRVIQVNFDETMQSSQYHVWHTADFPFDAVSVRRREYHSNIKGSWHIGEIASPKFQRRINEERARQRFHYRTRQTHPVEMPAAERIHAAYLALEIEVGAGQAAVKEAFRKLARKYHPDVTEHEKAKAEQRFKEVKSAYDQIKSHRRWH